jgi:4-hydroxy-3-methylbut-2-enyl diphosphate reductase
VQRRFEQAMVDRYGREQLENHFRKADTICGATQERQDALSEMLGVEKMNLLLVVGGYNSSNTSHLAEMGEAVLPTFFIKNSDKLISDKEISHYDQHKQQEVVSHDWLPEGNVVVGITAGASSPNSFFDYSPGSPEELRRSAGHPDRFRFRNHQALSRAGDQARVWLLDPDRAGSRLPL